MVLESRASFAAAGSEIFVYNIERDGDSRAHNLRREARAAGHEVRALLQQNGRWLSLFRDFCSLVSRLDIDIVESHSFKPAVVCCFARVFSRTRWICVRQGRTCENLKVRLYHSFESLLQVFADRVVVVSESQRRRVLFARRRTRVVPNAVDLKTPARTSQDGIGRPACPGDDTRLIVAVCRLSPEKGIDVLLDAFARLLRHRRAQLVIVGDGPERARLREKTERLRIEAETCFVGYTPTPGDYLAEADAVALPSRSEACPNAALEALAFGKPLVATAAGGTPEIVIDGETGVLVAPDDPVALADGIEGVLNDPVLAERISDRGRRKVATEFSIEARSRAMHEVYAEMQLAPRYA